MSYINKQLYGNVIPKEVAIFKQEIINEVQEISQDNPSMERLLGTTITVDVEHMEIIETEVGVSNEGQRLSGIKLLVQLSICEQTSYVGDHCTQPVHGEYFESHRSFFVIMPETIDGRSVCDYQDELQVTAYIEDIETRMLDSRHLQKCIMLLINVTLGE
ncbi:MAG: hypothetical protein R3Y54_06955 [Eubacteriales bacterium]